MDPSWIAPEGEVITQRVDHKGWTVPQMQFWSDTTSRQRLFCGGVGAGKTFAGAIEVINQPNNTLGIVVAPTFTMLKDSTLRTFLELYENSGLIVSYNRSDMTMVLKGNRTVLWRSVDKPEKIRGITAGWAWMDEAAYCEEEAYKVILGRLRKRPGRVWLTTTPNGKANWVYRLVRSGNITVIRASTRTNHFNPSFYVETLAGNYDAQMAAQEIDGEFVDTSGALMSRNWFKPWTDPIPERIVICRAWDSAATEGGGDFTCGLKMATILGTDKVLIMDRAYGQYGADTVDNMIKTTADHDGGKTTIVLEQEPGSAGKRLLAQQVKALHGYRVNWYSSGQKKLARAVPVARAAAQGRIYYVPGEWNESFLDEIDNFTGTTADEHDDQVDALSLGFSHLEGNVRRVIVA